MATRQIQKNKEGNDPTSPGRKLEQTRSFKVDFYLTEKQQDLLDKISTTTEKSVQDLVARSMFGMMESLANSRQLGDTITGVLHDLWDDKLPQKIVWPPKNKHKLTIEIRNLSTNQYQALKLVEESTKRWDPDFFDTWTKDVIRANLEGNIWEMDEKVARQFYDEWRATLGY